MVVPRDMPSYSFSLVEFTNAPYTAARRIQSVLARLGYEPEEDKEGIVINNPDSFTRELINDTLGARVEVIGNTLCVWPKFGEQIPSGHINDIVEQFEKEGLNLK